MKIILCDTNIVFPLFARIIQWKEISQSEVFLLAHKHEVYISETVLLELDENLKEQFDLVLKPEHVELFLSKSGLLLSWSRIFQNELVNYVNDIDDAQILQDAIDISADFLLSKNIKDFDLWNIQETFGIKVIGYITPELLS